MLCYLKFTLFRLWFNGSWDCLYFFGLFWCHVVFGIFSQQDKVFSQLYHVIWVHFYFRFEWALTLSFLGGSILLRPTFRLVCWAAWFIFWGLCWLFLHVCDFLRGGCFRLYVDSCLGVCFWIFLRAHLWSASRRSLWCHLPVTSCDTYALGPRLSFADWSLLRPHAPAASHSLRHFSRTNYRALSLFGLLLWLCFDHNFFLGRLLKLLSLWRYWLLGFALNLLGLLFGWLVSLSFLYFKRVLARTFRHGLLLTLHELQKFGVKFFLKSFSEHLLPLVGQLSALRLWLRGFLKIKLHGGFVIMVTLTLSGVNRGLSVRHCSVIVVVELDTAVFYDGLAALQVGGVLVAVLQAEAYTSWLFASTLAADHSRIWAFLLNSDWGIAALVLQAKSVPDDPLDFELVVSIRYLGLCSLRLDCLLRVCWDIIFSFIHHLYIVFIIYHALNLMKEQRVINRVILRRL